MQVIVSLLIGALVGWIAGKIMNSKGGLVKNILVGLVGGLIGVSATGWISSILIGIGGSCLLIWLMRKLFK